MARDEIRVRGILKYGYIRSWRYHDKKKKRKKKKKVHVHVRVRVRKRDQVYWLNSTWVRIKSTTRAVRVLTLTTREVHGGELIPLLVAMAPK